jgi:hypothetical protein
MCEYELKITALLLRRATVNKLFYKHINPHGLVFMCLMLCANISHAALIDRGSGLIYDDVQDITWLQDANYSKTSGYDTDGMMNWAEANTWANDLVYQGTSDWRLFTRDLFDPNCDYVDPITGHTLGDGCTGSELGYLYYNYFGLQAGDGLDPSATDAAGVANMNMFINMQNYNYWDGTLPKSSPTEYWDFSLEFGDIISDYEWNDNYAWAVTDGDVALVPEPTTGLLFMSSILLLALYKKINTYLSHPISKT